MNKILKKIQKSFDLLDLKKNWDGIGASPMDKKIYIRALEFMLKIMNNIDIDRDTEGFEIEFNPDGSINLNFCEKKARLSINVNKNGISFETREDGSLKTTGSYIEHNDFDIITWLNKNLKKSS